MSALINNAVKWLRLQQLKRKHAHHREQAELSQQRAEQAMADSRRHHVLASITRLKMWEE